MDANAMPEGALSTTFAAAAADSKHARPAASANMDSRDAKCA
ncbi:hypothetical protein L665_01703 [Ralstonia solanacearum SD54]|nr:hypothetical protein A3768_2814 [Ralstonia solanacearum]ESS49464.1 hypothetical protein L665_01703 [Ralstonia solanacearum SD54]